ncbi:MAG: type IX secretion system membrane protein PorP/SprF [Chitinophagaceae bacterium]
MTPVIAYAQDLKTSQYFSSPLLLNPALTGKFDGRFRISYSMPSMNNNYILKNISADLPVMFKINSGLDNWSLGFTQGTGKTISEIFTSQQYGLSTAYSKSLDQEGINQISVGFQGIWNTQTFHRDRIASLDVNESVFTGLDIPEEVISSPGNMLALVEYPSYFDANLGLLYNSTLDAFNSFYAGASVYHINKPCELRMGKLAYFVDQRFTLHAGSTLPLSEGTSSLSVSVVYSQQGQQKKILAGAAAGFNIDDITDRNAILYFGCWGRFTAENPALIPYISTELKGLRLAGSYDIGLKPKKGNTDFRNGFEITLIYIRHPRPLSERKTIVF